MKKIFVLVVTIMAFMLVGVISAQSGPPGSGYWFGAVHQNVGTSDATITITAYDSASSTTYPYNPAVLVPGASINVGPSDVPNLPSGFIGSIVTSSNQPLVALVNITNRQAGSNGVADGKAAGIYSGVDGSTAATNVNFPIAKYDFYNKTTTFYLQNAGSSAATIAVNFSFGGVDYPYTTPSIDPGQMVAVDPGLASVPSGNANTGAMVATSAQPIAGIVLEHEHSATTGTVLQGSNGFTPSELGQTAYCPAVKKNFYGRNSGVQVQNTHTATQDVTVVFVAADGTEVPSVFKDLEPGASQTFIQDPLISDGLYSVRVEGELGNVAAIVSEAEIPLVNARQTATTYNCQNSGSVKVSYPAYKEGFYGRTTALQIQNVGATTATNVVLTYNDGSTTFSTNPQTILSGASSTYICVSSTAGLWSGATLGGATLSGVTIESDQPLVVVANEASWASVSPCAPDNGASSFDKAISNGFNQ